MSGRIVVVRRAMLLNSAVSARVRMDGELVGKVASGESGQFEVSAGRHVVQARFGSGAGRSKKVEVDVAEGGDRVLVTGSRKGAWLIAAPLVLAGSFLGPRVAGHSEAWVGALVGIAGIFALGAIVDRIPGVLTTLESAPEGGRLPEQRTPARRDPVLGTKRRH